MHDKREQLFNVAEWTLKADLLERKCLVGSQEVNENNEKCFFFKKKKNLVKAGKKGKLWGLVHPNPFTGFYSVHQRSHGTLCDELSSTGKS